MMTQLKSDCCMTSYRSIVADFGVKCRRCL